MICPNCHSSYIIKNGSIHNGKQKFFCKNCGRQFVKNHENRISQETKDLIDKLLLKKIPIAGIARVTGVQEYVNQKYKEVPRRINVAKKSKERITIQCDEMWSFVGKKKNKQWIWLAIDIKTNEIVWVFVGERNKTGAQGLWNSLPPVYRQCAICYTDFWKAYEAVFPSNRHRAVDKDSGKTNGIERLNGTLRQRISRLVRKTLSFSKKLENHIGTIWYFIHHYNATLLVAA
ncbi:insertion element IS1 protein InsB [Gammaproteobacteria bacterium]